MVACSVGDQNRCPYPFAGAVCDLAGRASHIAGGLGHPSGARAFSLVRCENSRPARASSSVRPTCSRTRCAPSSSSRSPLCANRATSPIPCVVSPALRRGPVAAAHGRVVRVSHRCGGGDSVRRGDACAGGVGDVVCRRVKLACQWGASVWPRSLVPRPCSDGRGRTVGRLGTLSTVGCPGGAVPWPSYAALGTVSNVTGWAIDGA